MPCVVADTSPLFYLAKLNHLELLRDLYGKVHIPPEVWRETLAGGRLVPELAPLFLAAKTDGWLVIEELWTAITDSEILALDAGECEAIGLARQLGATLLVIDEKRGRAVATRFGLTVTGTLGVLVSAKQRGWIPTLKTELSKLRHETDFRFSEELEVFALQLVGEAER